MRIKMVFSYDGSCFYGFERQEGFLTVQGLLEDVLTSVNNMKKVNICASGRTDKGVHAKYQVAHFDIDVKVNLYSLKKHLNKKFNGMGYVYDMSIVDDSFHARYDCIEKTYCYYINTLEYNVFKRNYEYQYCKSLDILKMREASKYLMGTHDFRSFCKRDIDRKNCIRCIKNITILENGGIISIKFSADGFLRCMVRNIVSLLILVGSNKKSSSDVKLILDSMGDIKYTKSVLGCGLYLEDVKYRK